MTLGLTKSGFKLGLSPGSNKFGLCSIPPDLISHYLYKQCTVESLLLAVESNEKDTACHVSDIKLHKRDMKLDMSKAHTFLASVDLTSE